MANYVKATNFYTKDALLTGNPNKIIKGAEIDAEYNAIATAVASKADTTSPTFTGTPVAPTASAGNNTTQLATTAFVTTAVGTPGTMAAQNANAVAITGGTVVATFTGNLTGNTAGVHTGAVTGNVTGNITGSSGSCTGNAATATTATTATNVTNAIGQGQTWQNMSASRALATNYTNSTGKPILVSVTIIGAANITVDSIVAAASSVGNAGNSLTTIVPNGSVYSVTSGGAFSTWAELR
jgi:hypothetical protein